MLFLVLVLCFIFLSRIKMYKLKKMWKEDIVRKEKNVIKYLNIIVISF